MRNTELVKGLRMIAEGFNVLAVAFEQEHTNEVVAPVTKPEPQPEVKEVVKQEVVETPVAVGTFPTEEELNALSYNEIKAKAKELGLKAVGSKKAIIENILASTGNVDAPTPVSEEAIEEALETTVIDEEVKGEEVEIEPETEEVDEEALPEENTSLYDQVALDLEGYSDEELADILSEIGVSPKGRRQALLAKIVQAIEDGKLEWEDEATETVEEEIAPEEATEPSKDVEVEEDQEDAEEDFQGTEARKQACYDECDRIETDYEQGNISHKEIMKFLKDYHNGKYVSQGEDADLEEYMAIQCDLIDDEGTKHELADPYYIGDDVHCCGQVLKSLDEDFYCEICGTAYEV